jgi:hypothetical protein
VHRIEIEDGGGWAMIALVASYSQDVSSQAAEAQREEEKRSASLHAGKLAARRRGVALSRRRTMSCHSGVPRGRQAMDVRGGESRREDGPKHWAASKVGRRGEKGWAGWWWWWW